MAAEWDTLVAFPIVTKSFANIQSLAVDSKKKKKKVWANKVKFFHVERCAVLIGNLTWSKCTEHRNPKKCLHLLWFHKILIQFRFLWTRIHLRFPHWSDGLVNQFWTSFSNGSFVFLCSLASALPPLKHWMRYNKTPNSEPIARLDMFKI